MIECNLEGHKDIFYSVSAYIKHLRESHPNNKDAKYVVNHSRFKND